MLGGSPRGGDGTNVVLNEGSARWLGVCIGKRVSVVASGVRPKQPDYLEASGAENFREVVGGVGLRPLQQPPLRFERR